MLVSWLIPVFQPRLDWFVRCIASIGAQVLPDGVSQEIICVIDGDDGHLNIPAILRDSLIPFHCIYLPQNVGVAHALNAGIASTNGEWIARIDADDFSESHRLVEQLRNIEQYDLIGSYMWAVDDWGNFVSRMEPNPKGSVNSIRDDLRKGMVGIYHPTVLVKKQCLLPGYETNYPWSEDYATWCRLVLHEGARAINVGQALVSKRQHDQRASLLHRSTQTDSKRRAMLDYQLKDV